MGVSDVINVAIHEVHKSLFENTPGCIGKYRIIVQFSGMNEYVSTIVAEILDSDWIPDKEASDKFRNEVEILVHNRNIEFKELLEQAEQIRKDRIQETGFW